MKFVKKTMTQDERWQKRYEEVVDFIEANHRNPSKYSPEEILMVHFLKRGRKLMNVSELKEPRLRMFKKLFCCVKSINILISINEFL